jgi:hypothetical protein
MLDAFGADYRWSAAYALCLGSAPYGGADLGEVERVRQRLLPRVGDDDAWFDEWGGATSYLPAGLLGMPQRTSTSWGRTRVRSRSAEGFD